MFFVHYAPLIIQLSQVAYIGGCLGVQAPPEIKSYYYYQL